MKVDEPDENQLDVSGDDDCSAVMDVTDSAERAMLMVRLTMRAAREMEILVQ